MRDHNTESHGGTRSRIPEDRRIRYRIGVNLGDIVIDGDDILGDGVNIAARLEALAEPGGVCISGAAYERLKAKVDVGYADLGEQRVKNIEQPVRVYRLLLEPDAAGTVIVETRPSPRRWRMPAIAAVVVVIIAAGLAWWQPWIPKVEAASLERMAFPLPGAKFRILGTPFRNWSFRTPLSGPRVDGSAYSSGLNLEIFVPCSPSPAMRPF